MLAASFLGALCRVQVQLADGDVVLAQVTAAEAAALSPGTPVRVRGAPGAGLRRARALTHRGHLERLRRP